MNRFRPRGLTCGLLVLAILTACDRDAADEASAGPERTSDQREAARAACIGRELLADAEEDLEELSSFTSDGSSLVAGSAGEAARTFATTYAEHARIRSGALAYSDSLLNYVRTPADSARYVRGAAGYALRPPEPGTIEANVAAAYARNFAAITRDEDHPCNWALD